MPERQELDCDILIAGGGLAGVSCALAAARQRLLEGIRAMADRTGELTFAIENMIAERDRPVFFGGRVKDLLWLGGELELSNVGFCLDVGHCLTVGADPLGYVRAMGRRLVTTHLHDNDGTADQHLPPGYGAVVWTDVIPEIRRTAPDAPLVLEIGYLGPDRSVMIPPEQREQALRDARQYLINAAKAAPRPPHDEPGG